MTPLDSIQLKQNELNETAQKRDINASVAESFSLHLVENTNEQEKPSIPFMPFEELLISEEQIQKVKDFSKEYFEEYSRAGFVSTESHGGYGFGRFNDREEVRAQLFSIISQHEDNYLLTPEYRQALCVFLDEMIVISKRVQGEDAEKGSRFIGQIQEGLFATSPDVTEGLGFVQRFNFLTQVNREPSLWQSIGGTILGELTLQLEFTEDREWMFEQLLEESKRQSIADIYSKLDLIKRLFSYSIGQGYAEEASQGMEVLVGQLSVNDKRPLVRMYAETILYSMHADALADGVVFETASTANVEEIQENIDEVYKDSDILGARFSVKNTDDFPKHFLLRSPMRRIASDVIVIEDQVGKPAAYSQIGESDLFLQDSLSVDQGRKERTGNFLKEKLENDRYSLPDKLFASIHYLIPLLQNETSELEKKEEGQFIEKLRVIDEDMPWQKLIDYWRARIDRDHGREFNEKRTVGLIEQENEKVYQLAMQALTDSETIQSPYLERYHNEVETFLNAYEKGVYELAYKCLQRISLGLTMSGDDEENEGRERNKKAASDTLIKMAEQFVGLRDVHIHAWHVNGEQNREIDDRLYRVSVLLSEDVNQDRKKYLDALERIDQFIENRFLNIQKKEKEFLPFNGLIKQYGSGVLAGKNDIDTGIIIASLHKPEMEYFIKKETGVSLIEITLLDQVKFVEFLAGADDDQLAVLRTIIGGLNDTDRSNFIKSFLSLSQNSDSVHLIMELGKAKDGAKRSKILRSYAGIVDKIYNFEKEISGKLNDQKIEKSIDRTKVTKGLLARATEILSLVAKEDFSPKDLDRYEGDIVFFTTTLKELRGNISLEDLNGLSFESQKSQDITQEYQDEMRDIYRRNYASKPDLQKKLLEGFDNLLTEESKNRLHILKRDGKIISFNRFEDTKERTSDGLPIKYFGSFNVDPNYRGATIGERVLAKTLEMEAKDSVIQAHCDPEAKISQKYINDLGFVVTEVVENYEGTGETIFKIERDDQREKLLVTKKWSQEKALSEIKDVLLEGPQMKDGNLVLKIDLKDKQQVFTTLAHYINKGHFVMTRFEEGGEKDQRFVVLELEQKGKEQAA
ncbi:MAG: GNAT family N-acetyltransferase [Patescibacteria group bacterium]